MTFEEYENIKAELEHVMLELYHEKNINVSEEVYNMTCDLMMEYEQEDLGTYKNRLQEYKSMLINK